MSKTLTCDMCQKSVDAQKNEKPYGWTKLKLDHRQSGNIGGALFHLDACDECSKMFSFTGAKQKAIDFIKGMFSRGPEQLQTES